MINNLLMKLLKKINLCKLINNSILHKSKLTIQLLLLMLHQLQSEPAIQHKIQRLIITIQTLQELLLELLLLLYHTTRAQPMKLCHWEWLRPLQVLNQHQKENCKDQLSIGLIINHQVTVLLLRDIDFIFIIFIIIVLI